MQQLKKLYRSSYSGESVVKNLVYKDVSWTPELESVPNSVFNTHTTTQAAVIGNGESRAKMYLNLVVNHVSGIGGVNSLQTYGCNALYREHSPDFLVAVGDEIIEEIAASDYCNNNIVYANADALLDYPGKFYLIPQNSYLLDIAQILYLAAFDGHQEIFMLGYNCETRIESPTWTNQCRTVMDAYPGVVFYMVGESTNMPDVWMEANNSKNLTYREFISYCDV